MEGLDSFAAQVKDLRHGVEALTSAALSLSTMLDAEANRLKREDEAFRLRALHSRIKQEMDIAERREESASYENRRVNSLLSASGLVVRGIIGMVSKSKQVSDMTGDILQNLGTGDRPFGKVLVSIGPKGLPDEVEVVSISEKARNSRRTELEVMTELEKGGHLLLTEHQFSFLVDKAIEGVLQGQLSLPVSQKTASEMTVSGNLILRLKKTW